ncbi:MAG: ATP synthase F1 subunit delta [Acidimicrobiales bacterium]
MSDAVSGYADAVLAIASAEGDPNVEGQLASFAQTLATNDALSSAITDPSTPVERRQQVVEDLLGGRATQATKAAISMIIAAGRAKDLPAIASAVSQRGSAGRGRQFAEVRSAIPLTADQTERLAAALKRSTGKDVEISVIVDESVVGGLVTQIGDTVIDGSVRNRLVKMRDAFH